MTIITKLVFRKCFVCWLILFQFACFAEKSFYNDHARGWHWYEVQKKPKKQEENKDKLITKVEQYPATSALKKYQAELEEARALAVLYPTSENVFNYQKKQYEMIEKSGRFADVWMRNVYMNPGVDASRQNPVFQRARHVYREEYKKHVKSKITALSQQYGLFFFFRKQCPYCEAFAPIVKKFSDMYHWEVLAISEYGETLDMFERNVRDNGLAETWGVNSYPALFAVNPKTGHVIPIANGMISIQEMEQRIMSITKESEESELDAEELELGDIND